VNEESLRCSTEMLQAALELEERGRAFYDRARQSCRNPECREIFTALMKEEILHQSRIRKIYDDLTRDRCWSRDREEPGEVRERLETLFRLWRPQGKKDINPEATDLEAVDTGLALEEASISFYEASRQRAEDPLEAAFLDRMIQEERGHLKALKDIRYYLTDPQGWFMEKEKAGLDGA